MKTEQLYSTTDFAEYWGMTQAGASNKLRRISLEFPPDFVAGTTARRIYYYRRRTFERILELTAVE